MSTHKNHNGQDLSSFSILEGDLNPIVTQGEISANKGQRNSKPIQANQSSFINQQIKALEKGGELVKIENKSLNKPQRTSIFQQLKPKIAATLVGSAIALPILAVGTATYYFGNQAINKQAILAKRIDNIGLTEIELARAKKLLAALLIGTGTTALLTGAIAAFGTKKLIDSIAKISTQEIEEEASTKVYREFIQNLSQSIPQADILQAIVEEARNYLKCDRVVVYSLNQDEYGVIVAESVAAGYTKALGKIILDPCFEARYLHQYRDGRVRAIDNIYEVEMTPCHLEQLEQLEVKANLVTPIINEGKVFGLLVAHQCSQSRPWQQVEVEFLNQLAKKVGLALDNAKLLNDLTRLQTVAETERKWTNYFTDAVQYIRQSIKQDDVLEISVEEVRRVLECDRVVVYSLNQDNYGVVIAESVAPGYVRALNKTISDPCFEARYLHKYRDGRVRAIDNIYEAGMTRCYIEQLETLEVKANLVTPILNEGKLFGLLVAHQCAQPRHWQDYEIRWMTQIATQVGFALDNAQVLRRLKNESRSSQLLKSFTLGIHDRPNESELIKTAVEQVRKAILLDRVIVYRFDANWNGIVVAESVVPGYSRALHSQIQDPCFAKDYAEKYRQGRVVTIADIERANLTDCHLEQLESFAVKASIVAPILQNKRLFGLLIGHQCSQTRSWEQSEIDLFTQLAIQLGLALEQVGSKKELYLAENVQRAESETFPQQVSKLLTQTNTALQDLKAKISNQSAAMSGLINQIPEIAYESKAIAEETKPVIMLDNSQQNLNQMIAAIDDLQEKIEPPTAQLPIKEITVEAQEVSLQPINNPSSQANKITEQLVEKLEAAPTPLLINQFVEEIGNLSSQISQQSLVVTESFQKLATFAQQLSDSEESPTDEN